MDKQNNDLTELTAHIVGAYVTKNPIPLGGIGELIESVSASLIALDGSAEPGVKEERPAVNPKRSVKQDHIVCLECGKKFKSLRRHLNTGHGLSPDTYRSKWSLSADYPMVAPDYAAARSEMAKKIGLGRKPGAQVAKRPRSRNG